MSSEKTAQIPNVNITIDGIALSVPKGTTVFTAAKKLGIDIPIFCYQDRMPPFGACRMCLVEVEKMPKLQTSCTLEATEGMIVKTQSAIAAEGRKEIIEFLLLNHPLDCPICDRGGECPLQDQTLKYGPGKSRFFEEKRHFAKHKPLGPVLVLDRERCIICARCTRFGDIITGDHALEFMERGYRTEVGTPDGGPAESKFIGNTIMICPVGALTSDVYRFRARPWDNTVAESSCTLCPVGCSMYLDSRDGEIMRTRSHENKNVNDIWLCDKGWFGYEFTYHPDRLKQPLIRQSGKLKPAGWDEALTLIADHIKKSKQSGKLAAFGGNPLTMEENYLFQKLMRQGAGVNHVDHRIGTPIFTLDEEGIDSGMESTIGDCENLTYAILLGIDLTEEFPVIWLRLKQAINRGAKVVFLGHFSPEIAKYFTKTILHEPGKELDTFKKYLPELNELAKNGTGALFVGKQYLANDQRRNILSEVRRFQQSLPRLFLNILEGHGNSQGARFAGMRPDLGPFGVDLPSPGLNALSVLESASKNGWNFLYVAGANPAKKYAANLWSAAREKLDFLVVQDIFLTETAQQADVVLPTLSYVEKRGHFLNIENRLQKLHPGKYIPETLYSDGQIFELLGKKLGISLSIDQAFYDILKKERLPLDRPDIIIPVEQPVSKITKMQSKHLIASFTTSLFDNGIRMKHDPHVIHLAKDPFVRIHSKEGKQLGLQNEDQISIKANERTITAKVKLDDGVAENTIVIPTGFDKLASQEIMVNCLNGLQVEIKRV